MSLLTSKDPKQLGSKGVPDFSFPRFARQDLALCGFKIITLVSRHVSSESISRGRTLVVLSSDPAAFRGKASSPGTAQRWNGGAGRVLPGVSIPVAGPRVEGLTALQRGSQ